jgi:outer membrane receptor protein involved in Fe transport
MDRDMAVWSFFDVPLEILEDFFQAVALIHPVMEPGVVKRSRKGAAPPRPFGAAPLCLCVGLLLLLSGPARAQTETGQITGLVRDPNGDTIARAAVTVTSVATGATREATATEAGVYLVANLQPGVYDVRVEAPGFAASALRAQVTVGRPTPLDVTLAVGAPAEAADVVAGREGLQVDTQSPTVSTTITERQIKELPTLDRNPYALVQLAGNVSPLDPSHRGAGVAINGQRATSTNVLLDGGANNDEYNGTVGQNVPLDAVKEFTVLTSGFSAEFGRAGGGVVNVATKSGANELHGTVYEFNRNSALASARFEDNAIVVAPGQPPIKKAVFNLNQFGFSVGGPVVKDKLLFFGSAEWYRIRSMGALSAFVATPELLAASAPATQAFYQNFSLVPVVEGRVVRAGEVLVGPGAFRDLGPDFPAFRQVFYQAPVDPGPGAPTNNVSAVARVDWNASDRTTAYVRYALERRSPLLSSTTPYAGLGTALVNRNHNLLGSVTHVFTPRLVAQTKFVYNRVKFAEEFGDVPLGPVLRGAASLSLPGFQMGKFEGPQNLLQFYEDASYTVGVHALRFGGSLVRILDNRTFGVQEQSVEQLGFTQTETLNNLVLGRLRFFQAAVDPQGHYPFETVQLPLGPPSFTRNNRYTEWALYATDAWKPRPRVTLTLGLRYEYYGVQHNTDRSQDSNFYLGDGATPQERIHNGRVLITEESPVGGFYKPDRNNFAPRVGVAWDVFGDGRTSLRGGYGIGYERNFGGATINALQNPPNFANVSITAANVGMPFLPIYTDNYGPFSGTGTARLPRSSLRYSPRTCTTPMPTTGTSRSSARSCPARSSRSTTPGRRASTSTRSRTSTRSFRARSTSASRPPTTRSTRSRTCIRSTATSTCARTKASRTTTA